MRRLAYRRSSTGRDDAKKLVKFAARIVRHGSYAVFQLAEVAVPW
jgi:hypothetical protein